MKTKNKPKTHAYQSMKDASAEMGIPIDVLKWAKSQGAPGFVGSRVRNDQLVLWLASNQPAPGDPTIGKAAATLARILEQVRDLKRRNDEKERALVPVAWVSERMGSACSQWTRLRQDGKDSRCLTASGEHGVPVAMARSFYDQTTVDAGAALQGLAAMFNE